MPEQPIPENSLEQQPRIVSVNDRGGRSAGIAAKLGFSMLVLAVLVVGAVFGVNRYRAAQAAEDARAAEARKTERRNNDQTGRRVFSPDPPLPSGARAAPPRAPVAMDARCNDGSASQLLTGADGKPLTTPDAQEVRICKNGQVLIPAPRTASSIPGQPLAGAATTAGGATPPAPARGSRYGGAILLPSPASSPANVDAAPAPQPQAEAAAASTSTAPSTAPTIETAPSGGEDNRSALPSTAHQGPLAALLQSTAPAMVKATLQGNRDMTLSQDRSIDCNLSLRLVSEVAGKATCVLSSDVYGDSGRVVMAERGSVASGEYGPIAAQGTRRMFILWTRIRTPRGVIINLNSPAADAMGTSGLDGYVDNRWTERVGAAFLLSTVKDVVAYETATAAGRNGNAAGGIALFQNSTDAGNRLAERILDSTINIKPTVYKNAGDRATIYVARDLDFGSVYALRRK
jgi:type IV secretion system protein VirB10